MNFTQGLWAKRYQLALQSLLCSHTVFACVWEWRPLAQPPPKGPGEWEEIQDFLQKCGRCDKLETHIPLQAGARLESDMRIAVITGIHSGSLCLSEISLILTFGGSLISFPSVWKSISSNRRFCLQERRWIPIAARSSVWSEGSQCMTWKQKA